MRKKSMLLVIVMLAIGFAAVSTTLILNGNVGVGTNQDNYIDGVVFDEESLTSSDGTTAEISASGRTITFTTQEMKTIGEESKVNFKIKNYSQYNATLGTPAISCYFVNDHIVDTKAESTSTTHEYMQLIPGGELNGTTITAGGGSSIESSVTVKQIKSYVEDTPMNVKFQCEINIAAGDSETPSIEKPVVYNVNFNTNGGNTIDTILKVKSGKAYGELPTPVKEEYDFLGWYTSTDKKVESTTLVNIEENHTLIAKWGIQMPEGYYLINDINDNRTADIGDEIQVGTESFYVISHTNTELNALSKYNLKVGNIYNSDGTLESTIQSNEEGYGRQDPQMRGHVYMEKKYGTVAFSNQSGWPYENNDTIDIRNQSYGDGPVKTALYGENGYEKYIQETIPDSSVRLITKEEIATLINDGNSLSGGIYNDKADAKGYSWIYYTSYWTQSFTSSTDNYILGMYSNGGYWNLNFDDNSHFGVRPVITISLK